MKILRNYTNWWCCYALCSIIIRC